MYYSRYNMITRLTEDCPEEFALMNPLTGSFDLATAGEIKQLEAVREQGIAPRDNELTKYLLERGYIYNSREEEELVIEQKRLEFEAVCEESARQLLLIPGYSCNLACTYCFQQGIAGKDKLITKEKVDAFFAFARENFGRDLQKPFVTLFGGEPLIYTKAQAEIIDYIVQGCNEAGYRLAVVTNGYNLEEYIDILSKADIREIQVTVDGPREVHDSRRGRPGGKGTFDKIMRGLDLAINRRMPINFRTVVDYENLDALVELAAYVDQKGWLDLPPELFKTQLGRNYELFKCYAKPEHLMGQVELWAAVARLGEENPLIKKFHQPDFKGIKHLVLTGEMYLPSFDTCPAFKTEWVFDLHGDIYGCTASCGRPEYKAGTYFPEISINQPVINNWQTRNILTIPECIDCPESLICGGGCGVMAHNRHGRVHAPDCRPVKEIIDLGINYYREEILKL